MLFYRNIAGIRGTSNTFYTPKIAASTIEILLKSPNIIQTIPYYRWNLISADPDDNKFVDCAINVGADYIVTNDKHFSVLKNIDFPKINVIDIETLFGLGCD